ncbi:adenylate cyclase type 10 isoform X4 [Herpailurus yagouaroundi]|uniref:adenylate cyclase type 10 isoform X4 n=1 Tax=Herpailurus yagouaroundi TaxID=1608482 RepID=UPI001AD6951C|nr:adenylate cyclase type 10 isoform X4 [Puma yagouaroundi]
MSTRREESQDRAIVRIAAHLPDLIVYGDFSPERPSVDYFDGVLMFVDISGFTAMTEKFSTAMYMDRGAEQLVEILNHYISAIVEKVLIFGGDILKFAGDALLALWKVERRQLKNIITVVIKCSLEIHGLFETQESEEGLDVRVKIGLAAGHITMLVFGDETRNFFLVIGQAVDDVRLAQNMAQMNDVILSPNCWQLCDRSMIEIERIPDQRAVKVNFLKPPSTFNFDEFFTKCMTFMDYYPSGDHKNLLRLACMLESDPELELSLQKYVMESILKQIDDKQLRGYLSELRPVTIVFVNLTFKDQDKAEVIGSAIQDACVHINSVLRVSRGQINKVFMFDKTVKEERIIFIIDEGQFVDAASWSFLEKLIRTIPIFIIMSLSPFVDIPCAAASAIMKNRNTTYVTLGAVQPKDIRNKVCLDLDVRGIPKELDTYLVEGSCGIPFYCEELLKNLDHHRVLLFQPMEVEEKTNMTWNNLFKNFSRPTEELNISALGNEEGNEQVCNLASGVILKNLSPPASLKEISLVQLDSMSLSHQMLVRCAAIIGLTFTTELLFEVLPCWNMKMMIKALATLVESNIFDCFRNGKELRMALRQNAASFEVHYRSGSLRPSEGLAHGEEEELRELESEVIECHIIRFCRPMMQKTAYELWLKGQKKAMHLKCARFLEENAHRCDHCRSGDFIPCHHFTVNIRLNTLDLDTIKKMAKSRGFTTEEEITFSKIETPKKSELFAENLSPEEIKEKILSFFDVVITKMRTSEEDIIPLESCQCEEILEMVIMPLAHHFVALGENNKALYYFLEIASAYLILGDNYMAYIYLNEGERLLRTLKKDKSWSHTFESATFHSLKGEVCFNMGHMVLAKKMLRKALKLLHRIFPYNLISLFLQTHVEKNRHFYYLNQQAQESAPPGKRRLAQLYRQTACFSLLWQIYSLNYFFHYKYYGHLAAMMEVNTALETQDDFQIIKAYLDYSLHHQLAGYQGVWYKYEIMAMEQIFSLPLKGEGIEIVSYVADKLGYTKLLMGHLDLAIDLGSRAQKMWALLRNPNRQYMVLCWLSKSLFLKTRNRQLIQVLGWLWDLSISEEHIFSKAFFYFVCLDLMLYSGFVYKTFEECLEFIYQNEDNRILKFQSGILLGLYSSIAIWYARLQEWDNFHIFSSRAKNLVPRRTPTALYYEGISRYMEGQVLYLQKQIEGQSENAQDSGVELLKNLESLVTQNTTGPVFYPRLYHLMAYVCILMGDGQNCDLFLNTALRLSETQGNVLEKCWLNMSKEWWYSDSELMDDQWLQTVSNLPTWEKIVSGKVNMQDIQKNKFLMRVNILDNPF